MTTVERRPLRPWFRVLIGVVGFVVAGTGTPLFVELLIEGHLNNGYFVGLTLLGLYAAAGLLLLIVGLVGRAPSWLPVHEPGMGYNMLYAVLCGLTLLASDPIQDWLRTHLGMSRGASFVVSLLPFVLGLAVLTNSADRARRRRADST